MQKHVIFFLTIVTNTPINVVDYFGVFKKVSLYDICLCNEKNKTIEMICLLFRGTRCVFLKVHVVDI